MLESQARRAESIQCSSMTSPHVGTLGEKPLHASLKDWYRQPGDDIEVPVDGFVVDIVRGDLLIEIQTRSFSKMKQKLTELVERHPVRLVHPIALDRWIVKIGEGGEVVSRRRSPKHGSVVDLFAELVAFPDLINSPNLTVEVLLTREDEIRRHDPTRAWRRKGWVVEERHLIEVVESHEFGGASDLAALLDGTPAEFTTADVATHLGCSRRLAQQLSYCLRKAGAAVPIDKQGNTLVYRLVESLG